MGELNHCLIHVSTSGNLTQTGREQFSGSFQRLADDFPTLEMSINLHRFDKEYSENAEEIWRAVRPS